MLLLLCLFCPAALADSEFAWGTATASYQVEGYRTADGRSRTIWDAFDTPGVSKVIKAVRPNGHWNVKNQENGAHADEDYVRFPESVDLIQSIGFGAARMSIAWSRVMTYSVNMGTGKLEWSRNERGIAHYKAVLRKYAKAGISVGLTMFHWDLPIIFEEHAAATGCGSAWLCDWIGDTFTEYAKLLLQEFKGLVRWWLTINEPLTIIDAGYNVGSHAPGRCSNRVYCWAGDSHSEPYVVAKNMLLAHAGAFRAWEKAGKPGVACGMVLNGDWRIPFTSSAADKAAATRSLEWEAPIFADPIYFGTWPKSLISTLGTQLPAWTDKEIALVKGSHHNTFFMNHYTSNFVRERTGKPRDKNCGFSCDPKAELSGYNFTSGKAVGTDSSNGWLFSYGAGLGEMLAWYNNRYKGQRYIITENGWGNLTAASKTEDLLDWERCNYYREYLGNLSAVAARDGISVDGYFAWSLMDNYEWADGYSTRFGLTYVDYSTQQRTAKLSAKWFRKHVTSLTALPVDGKPFPACDPQELGGVNTVRLV